MAIFVEDIEYKLADSDLTTDSGAPNLLGNIWNLVQATIQLRVETWFIPTTADPVELNDASFQGSGWITDTSTLGRFADFNVGDSIEIDCGSGAGHSDWDGTYTITEKLDDDTIRVTGMDTTPHTMNHGIARNATEPTGFRYKYGLKENSSSGTTYAFGGALQEYTYNAIPSSVSTMAAQGLKTWQIADPSLITLENCTIHKTATDSTNKIWDYEIVHTFLIQPSYFPNGFYDFINGIAPSDFFGGNTLKHVIDFSAYKALNDPNVFQNIVIDDVLGNVGWRNQNFNQGGNGFVISSLTFTNGGNSVASLGLNTSATTVSFRLTNTASDFVAADGEEDGSLLQLIFHILPENISDLEQNDYISNNILLDRAEANVNGALTDGSILSIISDLDINFVSSTVVDVSFDITLTTAQIAYINTNQNKYYYLGIISGNKALTFLNSNITTVDIDINSFADVVENPVTFDTEALQPHDINTNFESDETTVVRPLDEFAFISKVTIDKTTNETNLTLENINLQVLAISGNEEAILQELILDMSGVQLLGGYPAAFFNIQSPLNVLPTETRKKILLNRRTDLEGANEVKYWIQWPLFTRYEFWELLALSTIPSFKFDVTEPNNGLNNNWYDWQQSLGRFGNGLWGTGTAERVTFTPKTISTGTIHMVVNLQDDGLGGSYFQGYTLYDNSSSGSVINIDTYYQWVGIQRTGTGNAATHSFPAGTMAINTNLFITVVLKAGGTDVYVNGVQGTENYVATGDYIASSIFGDGTDSLPFGFDELGIKDGYEATFADHLRLYSGGFGEFFDNVIASPDRYYKANSTNGTTLIDSGSDGANGTLANFDLSECPFDGSNACEWRPLIEDSGLIIRTNLNFTEGTFSSDFAFNIDVADDGSFAEINGYECNSIIIFETDGTTAINYIPTDRNCIISFDIDLPTNDTDYAVIFHAGLVEQGNYQDLASASNLYDRSSIGFFDGLITNSYAAPNLDARCEIDYTKLPNAGELRFYCTVLSTSAVNSGYVTHKDFDVVQTVTQTPSSLPKETSDDACCEKNIVFADAESSDTFKNDTSLYFKFFPTNITTAAILLQKYVNDAWATQATITNDTYGTYLALTTSGGYKIAGFKADWKLITDAFDFGTFRVKIGDYELDSFCVKQFTTKLADESVRIDYTLNSIIGDEISQNIRDFSGLNLQGSMRIFDAIFGYGKYAQTIEKERYENGEELDYVNELKKSFELQIYNPTMTIIEKLTNDVLLADSIYISDYNSINPTSIINRQPVVLAGNVEPNYSLGGKRPSVIINFEDRFNNRRKLFA